MKLLTIEEFEKVSKGDQEKERFLQAGEQRRVEGELTFEVKLPSCGRHGYVAVVRCRPLKVKDVKALIVTEVLNEIEYVKRVIEVLGSTIVEPKGFDVKEMSLNDFVKLMVAHRVNSIGSIVELSYDCGSCGLKDQKVSVDLVQLEERVLDDEYGVDPWVVKSYMYLQSELEFKFRFPRLSVFWRLASDVRYLDELNDLDLVRDAYLGDDFEELPFSVYRQALERIRRFNDYGIQRSVVVRCRGCGKDVKVFIPFFLLLG